MNLHAMACRGQTDFRPTDCRAFLGLPCVWESCRLRGTAACWIAVETSSPCDWTADRAYRRSGGSDPDRRLWIVVPPRWPGVTPRRCRTQWSRGSVAGSCARRSGCRAAVGGPLWYLPRCRRLRRWLMERLEWRSVLVFWRPWECLRWSLRQEWRPSTVSVDAVKVSSHYLINRTPNYY